MLNTYKMHVLHSMHQLYMQRDLWFKVIETPACSRIWFYVDVETPSFQNDKLLNLFHCTN